MNPKNTRKPSAKPVSKKKLKSDVKASPKAEETKSRFYVTKDDKVNELSNGTEVMKPVPEEPKKLERSNSFYLTRTLSKIYTKLSGSKENLDKLKDKPRSEVAVPPFKFQRSLTLNSIQLKKNYRKPFPETRLEKLSEEKISETDKSKSPPVSTPVRSRSPTNYRQSMPAGSLDDVDHSYLMPPKLERSDSFISLIRRKMSFSEHKASLNSNWATSLQSLQQIDNMVSYEDLSFVDYDKFNHYEQQIDKMLVRHQNKVDPTPRPADYSVVRRRHKPSSRMMGDFNSNLDREKNLYRQSIDSNKLRFLSSINLDSHRWSQVYNNNPIDWLSLENTLQAVNPT